MNINGGHCWLDHWEDRSKAPRALLAFGEVPMSSDLRLEFRGSGREYFRIWIVNLLLSILTLGIYSAWAKVRKKKYFYRNTLLDDHNFDTTPIR